MSLSTLLSLRVEAILVLLRSLVPCCLASVGVFLPTDSNSFLRLRTCSFASSSSDKANSSSSTDEGLWQRLDDIVRQWIYGTISVDLLNTIICSDDTAAKAWTRIENLFHDNKLARACQLDAQFNSTRLSNFSNVKEYCTRIKVLADKLRNVGQPVTDAQMVLRLLRGLSDDYKSFRSSIQHLKPLPTFDAARSMLEFEEASNEDTTTTNSDAALVTQASSSNVENVSNGGGTSQNRGHHHNKNKKNNQGRNGNNRNNYRNDGGKGGRNQQQHGQQRTSFQSPPAPQS